jgi:hypothetical protein
MEIICPMSLPPVNDVADSAVPPGVVTVIFPVVVFGTMAVTDTALVTVKLVAAMPLNLTVVAPVKLVPMMDTFVPASPEAGLNDMMVGAGMNLNDVTDTAVPRGVVTVILPSVILLAMVFGANAVIEEALTTVKLVASTPLNLTAVAPVRLVPVMATFAPAAPDVGVNDLIVGVVGPAIVTADAAPPKHTSISTAITAKFFMCSTPQ